MWWEMSSGSGYGPGPMVGLPLGFFLHFHLYEKGKALEGFEQGSDVPGGCKYFTLESYHLGCLTEFLFFWGVSDEPPSFKSQTLSPVTAQPDKF